MFIFATGSRVLAVTAAIPPLISATISSRNGRIKAGTRIAPGSSNFARVAIPIRPSCISSIRLCRRINWRSSKTVRMGNCCSCNMTTAHLHASAAMASTAFARRKTRSQKSMPSGYRKPAARATRIPRRWPDSPCRMARPFRPINSRITKRACTARRCWYGATWAHPPATIVTETTPPPRPASRA